MKRTGTCGTCLMPVDECDCAPITAADFMPAQLVPEHNEHNLLRAAADRAIQRGYVVLTKRRTVWQRFRDAWHAFLHGLT